MQRDSEVFKQCHFYKRVGFDNEADFYITKTGITLYGEREEVEILLGNQDIKTIIRKVNITSGISNVEGATRHYRILPYYDKRAREITEASLGETTNINDRLGKIGIIGDYSIKDNHINKYHYDTKKYGRISCNNSQEKIDIEYFSSLKEIIPPNGIASKAFWESNDCIIDGVAGSGKSTIAIQKLKILQRDRVLILAKDSKLLQNFIDLARLLQVELVAGFHAKNNIATFREYFKQSIIVPENDLSLLQKNAEKAGHYFAEQYYNRDKINAFNADKYNEEVCIYNEICQIRNVDLAFKYKHYKKLPTNTKDSQKNAKNKKLNEKHWQERNQFWSRIKPQYSQITIDKLKSFEKQCKQSKIDISTKQILDFCKYKIKQHFNEFLRLTIQTKQPNYQRFHARYLFDCISSYDNDITKDELYSIFDFPYTSIIIDEAQNLSSIEIENIRCNAKSIILAGDTLQTSTLDSYSDLINYERYTQYALSRNYRQVYELAQMTHNYRLLLQNRTMKSIESEYFDSEKGFEKPRLFITADISIYHSIAKEAILYRDKAFIQHFPIIIISDLMLKHESKDIEFRSIRHIQ